VEVVGQRPHRWRNLVIGISKTDDGEKSPRQMAGAESLRPGVCRHLAFILDEEYGHPEDLFR
jgi:hypothetical protein